MAMWLPYILVGVGGFAGANARFILARGIGTLFETRFPLGTFIVNMSGSFLLGVLGTIIALKVMPNSEAMRLALGVGFLGAFTTFSTFEFETHALFEDGSWLMATTNMFASLFVGLLALRAGIVRRENMADVRDGHEDRIGAGPVSVSTVELHSARHVAALRMDRRDGPPTKACRVRPC